MSKGATQIRFANSYDLSNKLDGLGSVDNRPSTDWLYHFVPFFFFYM